MAKVQKEAIHLVSTLGTGFFYTIRRNKKKKLESKVKVMKFDPIAGKQAEFVEGKLKSLDSKARNAKRKMVKAKLAAA